MGCNSSKVTTEVDMLKNSSKLEVRECFYEGNRYIIVSVTGKFRATKQVRRSLTKVKGVTRMPIKGSGHMCSLDYISTWKWCPDQPSSMDELVKSLRVGKPIFLI